MILEDNTTSEDPTPTDYSADRYGSDRRPPVFGGGDSYRRAEAPGHMGDEVMRVGEALDRLSARIEAAELRSTQAISGIDQSVSSLVSRLSVAEREQTAVAARFEGAVDDLRTDQGRVAERLRRAEQEAAGARSAEALKAMEGALAKVASHLYDGEERTQQVLTGLRQELDGLNGRVEAGVTGAGAAQLVEAVVARLSERLEEAESRTTLALRSLETSFGQLDDRLQAAEQRLGGGEIGLQQLAANLTDRVDAARTEMAEKIRDAADGRFDRIERTIEEMNGHVQAAERRSAQAIERMGHEVFRIADVFGRQVKDVEARSAEAIEQVGGEVRRMADVMETRLSRADMAGAAALEKLGGEIARITERLAERIGDAERRSAQAMDDVGDQLSRVTERMQDRQERVTTELGERIRQSEERTARLLEDARTRIDERLAETNRRLETKPAAAEPVYAPQAYGPALPPQAYAGPAYAGQTYPVQSYAPQAYAAPAYGEPIYLDPEVAPFGHDSFAASRPPAAAAAPAHDVALDTAEDDIDTEGLGAPELQPSAIHAASSNEPDFYEPSFNAPGLNAASAEPMDPAFDPFLSPAEVIAASARQAAETDSDEPDSLSQAWTPVAALNDEAPEPLPGATFVSQPFVVHAAPAQSYAPTTETYVTTPARPMIAEPAAFDEFDDDDLDAPEPALEAAPPVGPAPFLRDTSTPFADGLDAEAEALFAPRSAATRDLIEQARAATRAAAARPEPRLRGRSRAATSDLFAAQGPALRQPARRRQASLWTNALLISGAAAAMGVSVAGYALLSQKPMGALPQQVADALSAKNHATAKPVAGEVTGPILAEALNTKPAADASVAAPALAPTLATTSTPNPDAISLYGEATRRIESRDFTGVESLKKSANLGYAPAQFYLAKLYEGGEAGLHKDSAEARRWTERAAEGGDRKAMHNLALYYFEGTGGPKNTTTAAQWFRRAADLGLTDSQYNLGRLYEEGFGVAQNPAEAYKWYVIAARSGDRESNASALRVKGQLSVESQAAAERAAMSFLAQGSGVQVAQATTVSPVAVAQRALSHLGYYQGPADGADSPALKLAIAAYQRDQGLSPSGALDPALNERLSVIAQ